MNKVFLIGNLTRDPELRTTQSGTQVCSFTVAVNRRKADSNGQEADYFRVTAWRQLADICGKYLTKGKKVSIVGSVSVSTYTGNDGQTRASLDVTADDVEFLSPKGEESAFDIMKKKDAWPKDLPKSDTNGYVEVEEDELPF